jgi:hypothetical protein
MDYAGPGTYAFTFVVVMDGDSRADALEQAHDFLTNQSNTPSAIECLHKNQKEVSDGTYTGTVVRKRRLH